MKRLIIEDDLETFSLVERGRGLYQSEAEVDFNPDIYGMEEDQDLRARIEEVWRARGGTDNSKWMYNASKFRLSDFVYKADRGNGETAVVLQVGMTDYKDLQGTNVADYVSDLVREGQGGHRFDRLSQAIGVGCWVLTTDNKFFFIKNAPMKGEQGGRYDRPGGHPEPGESLKAAGLPAEDYRKLTPGDVLAELFLSGQKEIRDEINIPLEYQSQPEMIGIIYNLAKGGRVGIEFKISVMLSSDEVLQLYRRGDQAEADESTELVFMDVESFGAGGLEPHLASNLTPHAQGSLRFLKDLISS